MKRLSILVAVVLAITNITSAQMFYDVTDLGTLGGTYSYASGINDNGWVVGGSHLGGNSEDHAFLYDGTTMIDLGTLGGTYSYASGINDNGWVVGMSLNGNSETHAFLYDGTTMIDLKTLVGVNFRPRAINDNGWAVGDTHEMFGSTIASHASLYDGTTMIDLGTFLGGIESYANGINNIGQIVGESGLNGNSETHAFLYDGTTMIDLGTLGGTYSGAYDINSNGWVVGSSDISEDSESQVLHAFLYDGTTMIDLGTLGGESYASGINNIGQVIGSSDIDGNRIWRAFLYDETEGMVDLNTLIPSDSGWVLERAVDINNYSQIVGRGTNADGHEHAFLLTPVYPPEANAGFDQTVTDTDDNGSEQVTLDGSASTDPNGTIVSWEWVDSLGETIPDGEIVTTALSVGIHTIILSITDDDGWTRTDTTTVTVNPTEKVLTIEVDPSDIGIDTLTPLLGSRAYWKNETVTVNAEPFADCPHTWVFDHWAGDVVDPNAATTVYMDSDKTITAVYTKAKKECGDVCHPIPPGDLNQDCRVNMQDFRIYVDNWLVCTAPECD